MESFRLVWRRDGEAGFTILESVIALFIVFGTLLVLFRSLDGSIRVVNESRRQTVALALAGELLERARALEWENVGLTVGSNDADCSSPPPDDGIAGVDCPDWRTEFGVVPDGLGGYLFEGEKIVFVNGVTFDPFLSFTETVTRDGVDYLRFMFVTQQTDVSGDEMYRKITAVVQWIPPQGFRREVRQVTFASAFEVPPSPILDAGIDFHGGQVEMQGIVAGTEARPLLLEGTAFQAPQASVRARSDYVASALVEARAPSSEWVFASAVAPFETRQRYDADIFQHAADDDFGTTPPESPSDKTNKDLLAWAPADFTNSLAGAERTGAGAASNSKVLLASAVAKEASDDLPHAELTMESADKFTIGTAEYQSIAAVAGEAFTDPYWLFFAVWFGQSTPGAALSYAGEVDRYSVTEGSRKITTSFEMDAQEVHLFDDTVYQKNHPQFRGWLRITLPTVNGTTEAGEAALAPTLTSGVVSIHYWDQATNKYQPLEDLTGVAPSVATGTASTFNLDALAGTYSFDTSLLPSIGDTLTSNSDGLPNLAYVVTIDSLSFSVPLSEQDTYPSGATATAQSGFPTIGTGTLHYFVQDTNTGLVLFDYDLTFVLPGVTSTAAYIDPEQGP